MSLYVQTDYVVDNFTRDSITIDWPRSIIFIPKDELTLVQSTPTEIRNMDLNWFRLQLKSLEDTPEGMTWLKTHNHNTEVLLGGLTYARVIEILEPYTITFEDGQYAVNLVGANSNVGDRVNVNQVSVRSANSAGLISSPAIEFSSFNGGVIIDTVNGVSGTAFPRGTEQMPVNNIYDALLICEFRGFKRIYLHSDITLNGGSLLSGFELIGKSHITTQVIIEPSAIVDNVTISDCEISGTMDGYTTIEKCVVSDILYMNGHIHDSALHGRISLAGGLDAYLNNCTQLNIADQPIIDMGGSGQNLVLANYTGVITITNLSGSTNSIGIGLAAGYIILDSTSVTAGNLVISGIGELIDQNGNRVLSGVWNGGVNIENNLLNRDTISEATQLSTYVYIDAINGVSGTTFPIGTKRTPVNNLEDAVIIADDLGINDLFFLSDYTIGSDVYITGFGLIGAGINDVTLTFVAGCLIPKCHAHEVTLKGNLSGIVGVYDSRIDGLGSIGIIPSSQEIIVQRTLLTGIVTLPSNYSGKLTIIDCYSNVPGSDTPTLDFGNSTSEVQLRNYTGGIQFRNATEGNVMSIDLLSGSVKLEDSMTNATIVARGSGKMVESSTGNYIPTGIWNGGVNISNDIISKGTIAEAVGVEIGVEIQHSVFGGGVWVNKDLGVTGTTYPIGSQLQPVDNIFDAYIIAQSRGFKTLYFTSDYTFIDILDIEDFILQGRGQQATTFTLETGTDLHGCIIRDATITGIGRGFDGVYNSHITDLYMENRATVTKELIIRNCTLSNTVTFAQNFTGNVEILDSWGIPNELSTPPKISMNNMNGNLQMRNYSGIIFLEDITNNIDVRIFLISGGVRLMPSVTNGNFVLGGVGTLTDLSTSVSLMTYDSLISKEIIALAVNNEIGHEIQYGTFNDYVTYDVTSSFSGTTYPVGTPFSPVNNLDDALLIAESNGFHTIHISSELIIPSGKTVDEYIISSDNWLSVTLESGSSCINTIFEKVSLYGELSGEWNILNNCWAFDITNFIGWLIGGSFTTITLAPYVIVSGSTVALGESFFDNIIPMNPGVHSTLVMNDDTSAAFTKTSCDIKIQSVKDGSFATVDFDSGTLIVDETDIGGYITVRGLGKVIGTTSGTTINSTSLISMDSISTAVWDEPLVNHVDLGSTGFALSALQFDGKVWLDPTSPFSGITYPNGTQGAPVNNGPDALSIANRENITEFRIQGSFTTTTNLSEVTIGGDTFLDDGLTFNNNSYTGVTFKNLHLDGIASFTNCEFVNCYIENLQGLSGELINCRLSNYISIPENGYLSGVEIVVEGDNTIIDNLNVPGTISLDVNSGYILFVNCVAGVLIEMNLRGGEVEFDSSCVGGEYYLEGYGTLFNYSTMTEKGNHLLALETIPVYVWDEQLSGYTDNGSAGKTLTLASSGGVDYSLLSQAVWNELMSGHNTNDTAAFIMKQIATLADELHKIQGLSSGNPMNVTPNSRTSAGITLNITGDGKTTTTVTRQ